MVKGPANELDTRTRPMTEATTPATLAPDGRGAALLALYERAGYRRAEPAINIGHRGE